MLRIYENAGDFERCINVVKLKGGGYSIDIVAGFADGCIEHGLFKKYMEDE